MFLILIQCILCLAIGGPWFQHLCRPSILLTKSNELWLIILTRRMKIELHYPDIKCLILMGKYVIKLKINMQIKRICVSINVWTFQYENHLLRNSNTVTTVFWATLNENYICTRLHRCTVLLDLLEISVAT